MAQKGNAGFRELFSISAWACSCSYFRPRAWIDQYYSNNSSTEALPCLDSEYQSATIASHLDLVGLFVLFFSSVDNKATPSRCQRKLFHPAALSRQRRRLKRGAVECGGSQVHCNDGIPACLTIRHPSSSTMTLLISRRISHRRTCVWWRTVKTPIG